MYVTQREVLAAIIHTTDSIYRYSHPLQYLEWRVLPGFMNYDVTTSLTLQMEDKGVIFLNTGSTAIRSQNACVSHVFCCCFYGTPKVFGHKGEKCGKRFVNLCLESRVAE